MVRAAIRLGRRTASTRAIGLAVPLTIRIGCAASPRWYDLSLSRLDAFIEALLGWGATSTELVLHPGEGDEATARVHVVERDWTAVVDRFQRRGIFCHVHAPLGPVFKLSRWAGDRDGVEASFKSVFAMLRRIAAGQAEPPVLILHAGPLVETRAFVEWAALAMGDVKTLFAVELRRPQAGLGSSFDRDRSTLAAFVQGLADERVGICWDVAHDWEGGRGRSDWTAAPSDDFLRHVLHVHVHGHGRFDGRDEVHFPLQSGDIPWRSMLSPLLTRGYDGAMTIEARYRYACSLGDPWTALGESFALLGEWTKRRPSGTDRSRPTPLERTEEHG